MGALVSISKRLMRGDGGTLAFQCPGCMTLHQVIIGNGSGPRWDWNGSVENPTFAPSILVTWSEPSDNPEEFDDPAKDAHKVCHSFVTDGRIQFLSDCTHSLAGQTVEIPNRDQE